MFSINTQRNGNGYYTPQPQRFGYNPVNYGDSPYQKFPFSTFDVKKTEENIKNSMKNTENILKQKIITKEDIAEAKKDVLETVKVPLTQNQYDALVSFRFNVIPDEYKKSTLLRLLNQGNYIEASKEFGKWTLSNGEKMEGLVGRRADEKNKFTKEFFLFD